MKPKESTKYLNNRLLGYDSGTIKSKSSKNRPDTFSSDLHHGNSINLKQPNPLDMKKSVGRNKTNSIFTESDDNTDEDNRQARGTHYGQRRNKRSVN